MVKLLNIYHLPSVQESRPLATLTNNSGSLPVDSRAIEPAPLPVPPIGSSTSQTTLRVSLMRRCKYRVF